MKTLFKYLFYLIIIAILYIVISAVYDGKINSSTTMEEVRAQVSTDAKKIVTDTANAVENAVK